MNAFAKGVLSIIMGWVRIPAQWIMQVTEKGEVSSFSAWLGDHWLFIAVILCLLGTVIDFAVWFARWKPQLAWRTKWRKMRARSRGELMKRSEEHAFTYGYNTAVQFEKTRAPLWNNGDAQPENDYGTPESMSPAQENREPDVPEPPYYEDGMEPAAPYPAPGPWQPVQEERNVPFVQQDMMAAPEGQPPVRRRRSDRYKESSGEQQ